MERATRERDAHRWADAAFHTVFLGVGLVNAGLLVARMRSQEPIIRAQTVSWWWVVLLALWLTPALFYLRTWMRDAMRTRLWRRAPLVHASGLVLAAAGAVAALLLLLGAVLVTAARHGAAVTVTPTTADATVGMVHAELGWQALDSLPLLGATQALGWDRPVPDPDWTLGLCGMAARVAMTTFVVWTVVRLVRRMRLALAPRLDEE